MPLRRASHSVYDCQYHLVWTPKRRRRVLGGAVGERLYGVFGEIGDAYDIWIDEMHVAEDYVHLFCLFPPRLSISQVMTRLKSLSARMLFREFPELRRQLLGGELWEGGYFVRTVGDAITADIIRRYIQKHAEGAPEIDESQRDLFQG